ncbi:MAG: hypothetical protein WA354_06165 [Terracidiphilus sp.]
MSTFCGACGAPIREGAGFCGACGASTRQAPSPPSSSENQPSAAPESAPVDPPAPGGSTSIAGGAKSSSTWVKVAVVIIFVGGAVAVGGVIYLGHKVSQKAHELLGETAPKSAAATDVQSPSAPGSAGQSTPSAANSAPAGDACRLLSKDDVSHAIGVEIVDTSPIDGGCSYLAKGSVADMAAKHAAAMLGAKGADKKTQGAIEQFAGAIGNSMPKTASDDTPSADGNTVVLSFTIDSKGAEEQMKLNAKFLGVGATGGIDAIDGIGDEAFSKADSMMFVRKGDKLIRIMYMSCPCSTNAVKTLAQEIIANL